MGGGDVTFNLAHGRGLNRAAMPIQRVPEVKTRLRYLRGLAGSGSRARTGSSRYPRPPRYRCQLRLTLMTTSPMGHTRLSVKGKLLLLLMFNTCPLTLAILYPESRAATRIRHSYGPLPAARRPPIRLQVDGSGGTGKSYMVKALSSHLQQASLGDFTAALAAATKVIDDSPKRSQATPRYDKLCANIQLIGFN
jgi:hypothetical protein